MSMRYRTLSAVACDGCDAVASADWMDWDATLEDAAQQGWQVGQYHGGDDLCPGCLAQRDVDYERHERERREAMVKVAK